MAIKKKIYLASRSPRRRELLARMGFEFKVLAAGVDESPRARESPAHYVERMARVKARAGFTRVVERKLARAPVLAADTAVVLDHAIIGKPESAARARETLRRLSGNKHKVLTAVAVCFGRRLESRVSITTVEFRKLSAQEIRRYAASGEPLDKAGAYGIQGKAGAFVKSIAGSFTGVMGLPAFETAELLLNFGVRCS